MVMETLENEAHAGNRMICRILRCNLRLQFSLDATAKKQLKVMKCADQNLLLKKKEM